MPNQTPKIGVDLLGGEHPLEKFTSAIHSLVASIKAPVELYVFTRKNDLDDIEKIKPPHDEFTIHPIETNEVIMMDDDPLHAARRKKGASISKGMQMVRDKQLDAFVSTGNTGALMASARLHLKMIGSLKRPALLALLPTQNKPVSVIDVGANVHCTSDQLVQFARMGVAFQKSQGNNAPKIGLLNIGIEEKKGRTELRETYQKLQALESGFVGNVEGREVFSGKVDILVTDGFAGNVFLKTAEGLGSFILDQLHSQKNQEHPFYKKLEKEMNYAEYPGAILCGVNGLIIKCHGHSDIQAIASGVNGALLLVNSQFLSKFQAAL